MSAAVPTSSSSRVVPPAVPPASHPPGDSDPDPTPTAIAPSEVVTETKPDESITSLPPATHPQSAAQPPSLGDRPATVESHAPDPAPAPRPVPARSHVALTTSLISEGERPLPAVPPNVTLPTRRAASMRPRVTSDLGNGNAHSPFRRSEPYPVQPLELPGSGIFRQRPASHTGDYEPQEWPPRRVASPTHSIHYLPGSVGARLLPTLHEALKVRNNASLHAQWTSYSINIAIALQVLLGALTTALGASLQGNSIRISIATLGSLSTLVASYLARTRGTSEPESSLLREQAFSHFIRRLNAFILDHGMKDNFNNEVENFRREFERLLNASDPNAQKKPLFDLADEAFNMAGINKDELKEVRQDVRRSRPRAKTLESGADETDTK